MKYLPFVWSIFFSIGADLAVAQTPIPLWPERMPNSKGLKIAEAIHDERIQAVARPELIAFFPNREAQTSAAVIICPGGGYKHLAIHKEGYQVAKWLNTIGVNAFVLKYRLPNSPDIEAPHLAPLQDAQRAVKLIRSRAREWNLDSQKIGVLGFSAGGHLAATAGTLFERDWSKISDTLAAVNARPNFMILIYPVIAYVKSSLLGENPSAEWLELFATDRQVSAATPPAFIAIADDDKIAAPEQCVAFYQALRRHQISAELHIFRSGGHGFGLGKKNVAHGNWPALCELWLREMKIIE